MNRKRKLIIGIDTEALINKHGEILATEEIKTILSRMCSSVYFFKAEGPEPLRDSNGDTVGYAQTTEQDKAAHPF